MLAAAVAGAAGLGPGIGNAVVGQVRHALCIVAGRACEEQVAERPCVVRTARDERRESVSLGFVRLGAGRVVLRERLSDGTLRLTVLHRGRAGVTAGFGSSTRVRVGGVEVVHETRRITMHSVNKAQAQSTTLTQPLTLQSDTFSNVEPDWVTTPIQGVSFYQDHALVTYLDSKGISHLLEYHFTDQKVSESNEIAHAKSGHILTSPTATDDGHSLYWAEEWYTDAHGLSSNIWTRQEVNTQPDAGRMTSHLQAELYQYRSGRNSFRPQISTTRSS